MAEKIRQAVVIIHGMGEQRPLETLNGFIGAALPKCDGKRFYYSRPDNVTDSYEARRYLAPGCTDDAGEERYAQSEFFEYHWAHMMQGNRINDLFPTFRRILFTPPTQVPKGLKVVWLLFWAAIAWVAWAFWRGPLSDVALTDLSIDAAVRAVIGAGVVGIGLTYVVSRLLPSWLSTSFVDVVRYLDTSPRSYAVRREIREGAIDLLDGLHTSGRYDRIIVVAHSLGSYIAYDAITYLWAQFNRASHGGSDDQADKDALRQLETAAANLDATRSAATVTAFRAAQREMWIRQRLAGNPWLITDFVSLGSPMYFADRLYTKTPADFKERVDRWELPTCPPRNEGADYNDINNTNRWFTWRSGGRRVLYHGAPFAVVRWTNLWFPARLGFFGDWFGGPLAPLFGNGILDAEVRKSPWSQVPGYAHALYFNFPDDDAPGSPTAELHAAMDLAATSWVQRARSQGAPPAPQTPDAVGQER